MKLIPKIQRLKLREIAQDNFDKKLKSWIKKDCESVKFIMDEPENTQ